MRPDQFDWVPYNGFNLPQIAYKDCSIWTTNTAMVCFHMVEWHHADRVRLQFGLVQDLPSPPVDMTNFHVITMQGQADVNWEEIHGPSIEMWNDRANRCVVGRPYYGKPSHTENYMRWFYTNSKPFISDNQHLTDPRSHVNVGVDEEQQQQDFQPAPTTQTERRQRNRNRQRRQAPTQETNETFPETQPYDTHRHSISHTPTFQDYNTHNTSQDTYRSSMDQRSADMFYELFDCHPNTPESVTYLRRLQEEAGGAGSSNVPQYNPNPPAYAPDQTDQQEEPTQGRPRRAARRPRCGTGSHLM